MISPDELLRIKANLDNITQALDADAMQRRQILAVILDGPRPTEDQRRAINSIRRIIAHLTTAARRTQEANNHINQIYPR